MLPGPRTHEIRRGDWIQVAWRDLWTNPATFALEPSPQGRILSIRLVVAPAEGNRFDEGRVRSNEVVLNGVPNDPDAISLRVPAWRKLGRTDVPGTLLSDLGDRPHLPNVAPTAVIKVLGGVRNEAVTFGRAWLPAHDDVHGFCVGGSSQGKTNALP